MPGCWGRACSMLLRFEKGWPVIVDDDDEVVAVFVL